MKKGKSNTIVGHNGNPLAKPLSSKDAVAIVQDKLRVWVTTHQELPEETKKGGKIFDKLLKKTAERLSNKKELLGSYLALENETTYKMLGEVSTTQDFDIKALKDETNNSSKCDFVLLDYKDPKKIWAPLDVSYVLFDTECNANPVFSPIVTDFVPSNAKLAPGNLRTALLIGPFLFEWHECGLCIPRKCFQKAHDFTELSSTKVGQITVGDIPEKLVDLLIEFNTRREYSHECNRQTFCDEVLKTLGTFRFAKQIDATIGKQLETIRELSAIPSSPVAETAHVPLPPAAAAAASALEDKRKKRLSVFSFRNTSKYEDLSTSAATPPPFANLPPAGLGRRSVQIDMSSPVQKGTYRWQPPSSVTTEVMVGSSVGSSSVSRTPQPELPTRVEDDYKNEPEGDQYVCTPNRIHGYPLHYAFEQYIHYDEIEELFKNWEIKKAEAAAAAAASSGEQQPAEPVTKARRRRNYYKNDDESDPWTVTESPIRKLPLVYAYETYVRFAEIDEMYKDWVVKIPEIQPEVVVRRKKKKKKRSPTEGAPAEGSTESGTLQKRESVFTKLFGGGRKSGDAGHSDQDNRKSLSAMHAIPQEWREILAAAGVTAAALDDYNTAMAIIEIMKKAGFNPEEQAAAASRNSLETTPSSKQDFPEPTPAPVPAQAQSAEGEFPAPPPVPYDYAQMPEYAAQPEYIDYSQYPEYAQYYQQQYQQQYAHQYYQYAQQQYEQQLYEYAQQYPEYAAQYEQYVQYQYALQQYEQQMREYEQQQQQYALQYAQYVQEQQQLQQQQQDDAFPAAPPPPGPPATLPSDLASDFPPPPPAPVPTTEAEDSTPPPPPPAPLAPVPEAAAPQEVSQEIAPVKKEDTAPPAPMPASTPAPAQSPAQEQASAAASTPVVPPAPAPAPAPAPTPPPPPPPPPALHAPAAAPPALLLHQRHQHLQLLLQLHGHQDHPALLLHRLQSPWAHQNLLQAPILPI